ncbi:oxygenase MpaB family protein [Kitasatospora sp. LaBMicrA B282]|uniref:oxygenase MpaB family protein n=1 Tax=Kitasatospora sp. LaBMicrA B282 TaxID=3420949 RepID=UPI003D0B4D82
MLPILEALRARLLAQLDSAVHGGDLHLERYDGPAGDPGLFGPGSVVWRVHGHPAGMLTGGFAALLLQSLHPLAMAAVDRYSDFREDPAGRLHRTVRFVTTTSFGSTGAAEQAIAAVRRIHPRIHGTAPDGRAYRADDPDLLTWVHTAEVRCFLAGHQAFAAEPLTAAECDRYYAEVALLARRLGAREVPDSAAAVARYLTRVRPELRATPAAVDCARFLRGLGADARERAATRLLMNGSIGLLPDWARTELGLRRPTPVRVLWDRPVARTLGRALVWVCGPSRIQQAARARTAC